MLDERELAIHPIVQDSVQHNARVSDLMTPPGFYLPSLSPKYRLYAD